MGEIKSHFGKQLQKLSQIQKKSHFPINLINEISGELILEYQTANYNHNIVLTKC